MFQDCLSPLSMQAMPESPESLVIVEMGGSEAKEDTGETGTVGGLFLNIGLTVMDTLNFTVGCLIFAGVEFTYIHKFYTL